MLTFIGLVVALMATQEAINPDNLGATQETTKKVTDALQQLIGASAFKFITSIAGIGCSILISWKSRAYIGELSSFYSDFRTD